MTLAQVLMGDGMMRCVYGELINIMTGTIADGKKGLCDKVSTVLAGVNL